MKIDTKEKYKARYDKRGAKQKKRNTLSPEARLVLEIFGSMFIRRIGEGSKPNHQERFVNISDCFPLVGRKAVEQ